MWSFNDSGEETLPADYLALSVFSLRAAPHTRRLAHTVFHRLAHAFPKESNTKCLFAFKVQSASRTRCCDMKLLLVDRSLARLPTSRPAGSVTNQQTGWHGYQPADW